MSVTIHTFPPLHSLNSSRSWALAVIVLLHLVFFWAFSSGLGQRIVTAFERESQVVPLPNSEPTPPTPTPPREPVEFQQNRIVVPEPPAPLPTDPSEPSNAPQIISNQPQSAPGTAEPAPPAPVVVLPEIDARRGLSEPMYPAKEIRLEHTGTVILSVYVLGTGRVGEVRVEKSTGYPALDEAAAREARSWRLKPGTRDGVPVAMWKQIPITFRLKE